jgi:hypothetical protein
MSIFTLQITLSGGANNQTSGAKRAPDNRWPMAVADFR